MIITCSACSSKNRVPPSRLDKSPRCGKCKARLDHAPVEVRSAADFEALVAESPLPVLVDFWAAWCGPCRMVAPEMEKIAKAHDNVVVAKVDTEALPQVAGRFGIQSIPTMLLFEGGREATRISGAMPAAEIARRAGI